MLTKISINGESPCYAIILEDCECYAQIRTLQDALLWAIKIIAGDKNDCGASTDVWEIANLLHEMQPTKEQNDQLDAAYGTMAIQP